MRAEAETFDCQHPDSPLTRLICGDAVMRAADAEENGIYDTALTASLDKAALREEERAWFAAEILPYNWFVQHQAPIDNAKVVATYRQRGEALRNETQLWRKLRHGVPGTKLAKSCLALPMDLQSEGARSPLTRRSKEPRRCAINYRATRNRRRTARSSFSPRRRNSPILGCRSP